MKTISIASVATVILSSSLAFAHGARGLAALDRDGNGMVTRDEMRTTVLAKFDSADTNQDGLLTANELAARAAARQQERFSKRDKNNDGRLTRDEVARMPEAVFKKLDANGDGALTSDEIKGRGAGKRGALHFGRVDENHDGAISRDESVGAAERRFARIDQNHDGVVTAEEAKAGHHRGHGGKHGKAGQPGANQPAK